MMIYNHMKSKANIFLLLLMLFSIGVNAQDRKVSGVVTDSQTGETIQGVLVSVKGSSTNTLTNGKGQYTLSGLSDDAILSFTFLGMTTVEIPIDGKGTINATMERLALDLDEIVVVGYGTQSKRDVTGSIVSVSGEDMGTSPGGTIVSALQGKVPGMQIITNSGEPGAGASIQIRGASSISGGNEPLYIVDGVPIDGSNITALNDNATFSPLAGIDPNDIESIEILKDAASGAIYGSRAANGVVIITTKGGNKFENVKPRITLSHTSSLVQPGRKMDVMNSGQFREAYVDARTNNGSTINADWIDNPHHPYYNNTTDWQDLLFRDAYQHSSNLGIRGSSETFSYGISLGYRNLQPTIVHTDYGQMNARGNFSYRITKNISAETRVSYSDIDYTRILSSSGSYYSALRAALFTNPVFTPFDPLTGELMDWLGKREQRNPLAVAEKVPATFDRNTTTLTQNVTAELLKGLKFKTSVYATVSKFEQSYYQPKTFSSSTPRRDDGRYQQQLSNHFVNENTLSYNRLLKKHRISAVLGQSIEKWSTDEILHYGEDFVDPNVTPIQGAARMTRVEQNISKRAMLSFFGRVNYSYAGRYLASFTMRRDGSSRFGANRRYGNFPAATFGWRFSDESFMDFAGKILDNGMIRGSFGITGNQVAPNYAWQGQFSPAASRYDGNVAILHDAMMNNRLGWETTTQYNVGLDLSMFKKRVSFTADVYKKQSEDLLFSFPLNDYTGFNSVTRNYGSIENRGLELLLETVNLDKAVRWETGVNFSLNRNKVTALPEGEDILIGDFSLGRIGEPAGVFYAHRALGVYANDSDNVYYAPDGTVGQYTRGSATGEVFKGGDMIWDDIDGNGIIDDNDRVIIGNPHPKFIGGFNNSLAYKNVSLKFSLYWSYGNQLMNTLRRRRNQMLTAGNLGQDALRRWREQGDVTDFPMLRYQDLMGNFRTSSFTMEDGSFVRLKEIVLGYTVPSKYLKRFFFNSLGVYVSGTNLLTWSSYSGLDPEVNTSTNPFISGADNGALPQSRSYNFGITAQF